MPKSLCKKTFEDTYMCSLIFLLMFTVTILKMKNLKYLKGKKCSDRSIGSEIITDRTDRPTNQPVDRQTDNWAHRGFSCIYVCM